MILLKLYYKIRKKEIPYYAKYSLWKILTKPIIKYLNVVIIPTIPFTRLRVFMYRAVGFKIGKKVFIGMRCYLDDLEPQMMIIGDGVVISYGCFFSSHGKGQKHTLINIKPGAYIGMRATIVSGKKGITIGENSIIAAGATVVKDVAPNSIVGGTPAKVIGENK